MKAVYAVVAVACLAPPATLWTLAQSAKTEWAASELGCGDWTKKGSTLRRESASSLAKSLEGFREVRRRFRIEELNIDCGGRVGSKSAAFSASLFVRLRARANGIPNGIEWSAPLECCWKPTVTWTDLLELYEQGSAIISRHQWLAIWANRARRHEVRILASGDSGVDDSDTELANYVRPVWELARFEGEIVFQVLLRRHGEDPAAELYFSDVDKRALVTITWPADDSEHWLDMIDVHAHPTGAPRWDYVTVQPSGNWHRPKYHDDATDDM